MRLATANWGRIAVGDHIRDRDGGHDADDGGHDEHFHETEAFARSDRRIWQIGLFSWR
jgi:hypothetical protein